MFINRNFLKIIVKIISHCFKNRSGNVIFNVPVLCCPGVQQGKEQGGHRQEDCRAEQSTDTSSEGKQCCQIPSKRFRDVPVHAITPLFLEQ